MLIRFNVSNFLSFDKKQEFSMISGKPQRKSTHIYENENIKLLKFASLFGANASGKSNFVSAIGFAKSMIATGFKKGYSTNYFKGNNENKKSYFEFEIKIDDKYFAYGFEIILSIGSITSEWLFELLPNGSEKEIFTRNVESNNYSINKYFKSKVIKEKLDLYASDVKSDDEILFLKLMNRNKDNFYIENPEAKILKNLYNWIEKNLDINYPDEPITDYSYFIANENLEELNKVLSSFGTGVKGFQIVDVELDTIARDIPKKIFEEIISMLEDRKSKLKKDDSFQSSKIMIRNSKKGFYIISIDREEEVSFKTVKFNHGFEELLSITEESDGTVRLLDLLQILFDTSDNKTFIVDEIDRCLHPQLTYKLIETFLNFAKKRNVQLIVTSHESRLLDYNLLRRDEIWFADKSKEGATKLYSLEEYNVRFDQRIDKAYLEGRYGGVPLFDAIYPISFKGD